MRPFLKAFLSTFLSDVRCCSGIFTYMENYPPTSPLNNEDDLFWNDASMLVLTQFPGRQFRLMGGAKATKYIAESQERQVEGLR